VFIDDEAAAATRVVMAGVTLGNDWAGFHTDIAAGYTGLPEEYLDVTLPLHVTWLWDGFSDGSTVFFGQVPSTPITSYDWFQEQGGSAWGVSQIAMSGLGYNQCPDNQGLEMPLPFSAPAELTLNGQLHVRDTFGGTPANTVIIMTRFFQIGTNPLGGRAILVLSWDGPGTKFDDWLIDEVHVSPGAVYNRRIVRQVGTFSINIYTHVRIVEWVSPDLGPPNTGGPSPGTVDAADLAYWHSTCEPILGQFPRWGFESGGGETPALSPTYQCDVVPQTAKIDASDLARFYGAMGDNCQLSKTQNVTEFAAILDWFGVAPTGEVAPVNGELLPLYAVVDWEKNRRAIADPYGYRTAVSSGAAKEVPWGLVKQLYR